MCCDPVCTSQSAHTGGPQLARHVKDILSAEYTQASMPRRGDRSSGAIELPPMPSRTTVKRPSRTSSFATKPTPAVGSSSKRSGLWSYLLARASFCFMTWPHVPEASLRLSHRPMKCSSSLMRACRLTFPLGFWPAPHSRTELRFVPGAYLLLYARVLEERSRAATHLVCLARC